MYKYALLMNPLARSIEELLPIRVANSLWCYFLLRTALVASSVCVAFSIPFFGKYRKLAFLVPSHILHGVKFILQLSCILISGDNYSASVHSL
jgi:hypothetical protein